MPRFTAGSRPDQIQRLMVSSDRPARLAASLTLTSSATVMRQYYYNNYIYASLSPGPERLQALPCGAGDH